MTRVRRVLPIVGVLFVSGCFTSPVKFGHYASTSTIETGRVGEVLTRKPGEVLVAKGTRTTTPAIRVLKATPFNKAEGEGSVWTCALSAMPGTYPQRGLIEQERGAATCFGPVTIQMTLTDGRTNWNCPGKTWLGDICRSVEGGYFVALTATTAALEQQFENIQSATVAVEGEPNLVQELVYDGWFGDRLGFTYREFVGDVDRPSYSQGFQHHLADSTTVEFRSLRLEVIETGSSSITYRIVSGFDGR